MTGKINAKQEKGKTPSYPSHFGCIREYTPMKQFYPTTVIETILQRDILVHIQEVKGVWCLVLQHKKHKLTGVLDQGLQSCIFLKHCYLLDGTKC